MRFWLMQSIVQFLNVLIISNQILSNIFMWNYQGNGRHFMNTLKKIKKWRNSAREWGVQIKWIEKPINKANKPLTQFYTRNSFYYSLLWCHLCTLSAAIIHRSKCSMNNFGEICSNSFHVLIEIDPSFN